MRKDFQVSMVDEQANRNLTVLRIASAAKNSITQLYSDRAQISLRSIEELHRKLAQKLNLHQVSETDLSVSIQFTNDRSFQFTSIEHLKSCDLSIDSLTQLVTLKWSFVFDPEGNGNDHLHTVYVRMSERPSAGVLVQRLFSSHNDDIDSLDGEAFAPIACKIDFLDGRFSTELLAVVTEWVKSLPKAVPTFGMAKTLLRHEDKISSFIYGTFPAANIVAYVALWILYLPPYMTGSTRNAAAWVLGGGVIFLLSRYFATLLNRVLEKSVRRICSVPVFQVTAGDNQRITIFLAKSQKSMITLSVGALIYGFFKAVGIFLAGKLMIFVWP